MAGAERLTRGPVRGSQEARSPAAEELGVRLEPPVAASEATLLYLHGLGSDQAGEKADFFRNAAVRSGLGFCSFDFRGHGQSPGAFQDLTLSRQLEDVAVVDSWLRERVEGPVAVLGSSLGGLTGLWHCALSPRPVDAGLHIAPAVGVREETISLLGPEPLERWRAEGTIVFSNDLGECELGWGFMEDLAAYPTERLAGSLSTRSLLLQGQLDSEVSWQRVAAFAASCGKGVVELRLFEDGDHRLLDRKEALWLLMEEFLRGG